LCVSSLSSTLICMYMYVCVCVWTCVCMYVREAPAIPGKCNGFIAHIWAIIPNVKRSHFCIHGEWLAARKMPQRLKTALDEAVEMVNFINAHSLNSHIFNVFCRKMGSAHEQPLFSLMCVDSLAKKYLFAYLCCVMKYEYFSVIKHFNEASVSMMFLVWYIYLFEWPKFEHTRKICNLTLKLKIKWKLWLWN
jgi:hypothetical protein